jgi:hypothetical protein
MTYVDSDEPLVDYRAPAAQHVPSVYDQEVAADWYEEPAPVAPAPRLPADVYRSPRLAPAPVDEPEAPPAPPVTGVGFLSRWLASNPVRVWLYGVLLAAVAILVSKGLLTESDAYLWSALGAAVLGVPLTEAVRGSVYSPRGAAALAYQTVLNDRSAR